MDSRLGTSASPTRTMVLHFTALETNLRRDAIFPSINASWIWTFPNVCKILEKDGPFCGRRKIGDENVGRQTYSLLVEIGGWAFDEVDSGFCLVFSKQYIMYLGRQRPFAKITGFKCKNVSSFRYWLAQTFVGHGHWEKVERLFINLI